MIVLFSSSFLAHLQKSCASITTSCNLKEMLQKYFTKILLYQSSLRRLFFKIAKFSLCNESCREKLIMIKIWQQKLQTMIPLERLLESFFEVWQCFLSKNIELCCNIVTKTDSFLTSNKLLIIGFLYPNKKDISSRCFEVLA